MAYATKGRSFGLEFTPHAEQVTYDSFSVTNPIMKRATLAPKGRDELHNEKPGSG